MDEYTFSITADGKKIYYRNGTRIAFSHIPVNCIKTIKERSIESIIDNKFESKRLLLLERRQKLYNKIIAIDTELSNLDINREAEKAKARINRSAAFENIKSKPKKEPETEAEREWRNFWEKFKNDFYSQKPKQYQNHEKCRVPTREELMKAARELLAKNGINNKKDWKNWIMRNHTDKLDAADPKYKEKVALVGIINDAVRTMEW